MTPTEQKVPAVIRNEIFYAFARVCMILATVVGLPVAGVVGSRLLSKADEISEQVQKQSTALLLLSAEVKYRFGSVEDHEQRLRKLELGSVR